MATVTISLSASLRDFVATQTRRCGYESEGAYLESLVRQDQARAAKIQAMQARIEEWLASGIGQRSMDEVIAEGWRPARYSS